MSSIISSDFQSISKSPLNNSLTKQLYSFPKDPRFKSVGGLTICKSTAYNLPDCKAKRSAGIGYANKHDFTKQNVVTPSPQMYEKQSLFDDDRIKKKGPTFGLSRDAMPGQSPLNQLPKWTPGVGNYESNPSTLSQQSWSLRQKTSLASEKNTYYQSPGPGTYPYLPSINEKGKFFNSKFMSSKASNFNPASSTRFQKDPRFNIPAPGAYDLKEGITPTGKYFQSKMLNSQCKTFSKDLRKFFDVNSISPGVGSYRLPSEFGYYDQIQSSQSLKTLQ